MMRSEKPFELISNVLGKIDSVSSIAGKISGLLSFLLMLLISGDVFLRYFFNTPIPGTNEIARLTLAWVCFLGIFYAYTNKVHVRVTVLINKLPRYEPHFELLACFFGLIIFSFLTYKSSLYFWESWINRELYPAPIPVPHWLAKLSMPIGSFCMLVAIFFNMISQFFKILDKREV
jgi:TRAP-type C4-dicarboxylate transport system permease small subunit